MCFKQKVREYILGGACDSVVDSFNLGMFHLQEAHVEKELKNSEYWNVEVNF